MGIAPKELLANSRELHTKTPIRAGVYMIFCRVNEYAYIGSSATLYSRLSAHKAKLSRGKHFCSHMQRSWDKYGKGEFRLVILDFYDGEVTSQNLLDRENHYLLMCDRSLLFNMHVPAILGGTPLGTKMSAEARRKMSEQRKGKSATWNIGRKHSEEWRKRQSEWCKKNIDREHFERMSNMRTTPVDVFGEKNPKAKLTWDIVNEIRAIYDAHMERGDLPKSSSLFKH